jgi:hypothetical protein
VYYRYNKHSLIWIKLRGRSSGIMKQKLALKDEKKLRKQITIKCNNIGNADENK